MFAVIGGSGLTRLNGPELLARKEIQTPYGAPSAPLLQGRLGATEIVFLARHGEQHQFPPHRINYRANLWALAQLKVQGIISIATVGSLIPEWRPGALVLPDQLIDYTSNRDHSFFDAEAVHVDFTEPFDGGLRGRIAGALTRLELPYQQHATYGCTQGPRLESAAEIRRLRRDGCDLVGMTAMPEAGLARELTIPYATLAVVANHAAGIGESAQRIALEEIPPILEAAMAKVLRVLSLLVQGPASAASNAV
jgi:5'-deoxy-5'-methylthioadenosine phosphorylase